jgi:O-methyltransferase involved in polyketide biosynthesis
MTTKIGTAFTGIRNSAYVTLCAHRLDSRDPHSLLHDSWAAEAADRLAFDFDELAEFRYARFVITARSRVLDGWTRRFLTENPAAVVLDLGSGFDSRVFRVDPGPGHHWYDVDFPDVIEVRDRLYPQRPGHTGIGTDLTDPGWLERLPADRPVIVVADSLFMFLPEDELRRLLCRVLDHFPRGEIVFTAYSDLVLRQEAKKGLPPFFAENDIRMRWTYHRPGDVVRFDDRLQLVEQHSQTDLRVHRGAALYDKLMCVVVNLLPGARNSSAIVRLRF